MSDVPTDLGATPSELSFPMPDVALNDMRAEVEQIITVFAEQTKKVLDHDRLSIYLLTPDGVKLERFAVATSPLVPGEGELLSLDHVGIARVVRCNEPILSDDFGTDERIRGSEDALIASAGFHAIVSVPLRWGGRPFGLLNFVSRTPGFYREDDVVVAQHIADQVAVFLLNLRLQRAMRLVARREATELERNRVAREFHDTLAQALAEIAVKANALAASVTSLDVSTWGHATAVRDLAHRTLDDVRRSLHDLRPAELEDADLGQAIERSLAELSVTTSIHTAFELSGDPSSLPDDVQIGVFRIFQQAVANAHRHAGASSIVAELRCGPRATLIVQDDGRGFVESPGREAGRDSFGLAIMRERARALRGELTIAPRPPHGTEVRLEIEDTTAGGSSGSRLSSSRTHATLMSTVVRVLVVDDHVMVREGLCDMLRHQHDIRVVGEAGTGRETVHAVRRLRPDVVLLDLGLPDMTGVEVAAAIQEHEPGTVILMMSAFADEQAVHSAIAAGARGYITKTTAIEPLVRAIRTAMHGVTVFSDDVSTRSHDSGATLTKRELEIVRRLAQGRTNAEIAGELHLALKTIERIVASIVTKLRARNRTHAVAKAAGLRLIQITDLDA